VVCDEDSELSWLAKYPLVPFDPQVVQDPRKSEFPLPPNMGTAIEFGHFDHLEDTLPRDQYRRRLHILLHIEEYERRRQMTRFAPFFFRLFRSHSSQSHAQGALRDFGPKSRNGSRPTLATSGQSCFIHVNLRRLLLKIP